MKALFDESYPNITHFVKVLGWIEIGHDEDSPVTSFIRAINPGGIVWEGENQYKSLDEAFQDLERGLGEWMLKEAIE